MINALALFLPKSINKTWIVLGVALTIGLLAALGTQNYLNAQMATMEARAKGKTVSLVVAKRDLAKGEKLSSDNLAIRPIPVDYALSNAVSPEQFDRIDGKVLANDMKSGEMLLWSALEGQRAPTFSKRVSTGHRAVTVPVDEINSISGMLEPGDLIDLMLTVDHDGKKVTFPLLQSIPVMATGQRANDNAQPGEHNQFATITLDATLDQAKHIIAAREIGKITALLRNPEDKQSIGPAIQDISAYLAPKVNPVPNTNPVPVLYGGRDNTSLTMEALNKLQQLKPPVSKESGHSTVPPAP